MEAEVPAEDDRRRPAENHALTTGREAADPSLGVAPQIILQQVGGRWRLGGTDRQRMGNEASSRCTGVLLASSGDSCSAQGPHSATSASLVVTRCKNGTPSRCARPGATTLPPAP
jgi:hypothetical protein